MSGWHGAAGGASGTPSDKKAERRGHALLRPLRRPGRPTRACYAFAALGGAAGMCAAAWGGYLAGASDSQVRMDGLRERWRGRLRRDLHAPSVRAPRAREASAACSATAREAQGRVRAFQKGCFFKANHRAQKVTGFSQQASRPARSKRLLFFFKPRCSAYSACGNRMARANR